MIRKILLAAMIGTSAVTVAFPAIARDRIVYVQVAPPVIREEVVPAPRRGYAWAPGYWGWRHSKHVWVRGAWVRDPQGIKPGCGMPGVFTASDRDRADAQAITQFLVSLAAQVHAPLAEAGAHAVDEGRRLYHTIGCVACHGALESPAKVFAGATGFPDSLPDASPAHPFGTLEDPQHVSRPE